MAEIVPIGNNAAITYFEQHLTPWATNQGSIGITLQQAGDIVLATQAARNLFDASGVAHSDAKVATEAMNVALSDMRAQGAAIIKTVKAFAESTNDPAVFQLAVIPAPTPANPLPPPSIPISLTGKVNNNGQIEMTWKSDLKGRIFFRIERQVVPTGQPANQWEIRGAVATKTYVDTEVPANATSVLYRVAAIRNEQISLFSDPVTVMLSTPGAQVA